MSKYKTKYICPYMNNIVASNKTDNTENVEPIIENRVLIINGVEFRNVLYNDEMPSSYYININGKVFSTKTNGYCFGDSDYIHCKEYDTELTESKYNLCVKLFGNNACDILTDPNTVAHIEDIPTKVSQLENDVNYIDDTYVDTKLEELNELIKQLQKEVNELKEYHK